MTTPTVRPAPSPRDVPRPTPAAPVLSPVTPETWADLDRALTGHAETAYEAARAACHTAVGVDVLPAPHLYDTLGALSRTTHAVAEACTHLARGLAAFATHPGLDLTADGAGPALDDDEASRRDHVRAVTARAVNDLTAAVELAHAAAAGMDLARSLIAWHSYTPRETAPGDP